MSRLGSLLGTRHAGLVVTLLLVAANIVAFNTLISGCSARLDLTGDRMFSISPATRRLLSSLDDDLWVTGYFSKRTHPKLAPLVPQIADLLDEYQSISKGRVHVDFVDPGEDETAEEQANQRFGVQSTPFRLASKYESGIVNAYFALVVRYGDQYVRYGFDDLIEVEALPDGDVDVRLRNLEYDLTRAIKKVVFGFRSAAELFERIGEPVRLTAILTPDRLPELLRKVPEALRTAAAELEESAGGRFEYTEIVPADAATRQEVAARFGARPMSLGLFSSEDFYLYGLLDVGGRVEQLALTGEGVTAATIREGIENSLRRQTPGFLKTVGMVTPAPSIPPEVLMQMQMQGQTPPQPPPEFEQVKRFLGQDYTVRDVSLDQAVGGDVDILVVLKPRDLSERAVYHLDQYLMRGGRVVIGMGSYEPDFNQGGLGVRPVTSGLDGWLRHFGVDVARTLVLDDRNQPLPIPQIRRTVFGNIRTWSFEPYPYLVEIRDDGFLEPAITARLGGVGFYWGSPIRVDPDSAKGLERIEILRSSKDSWTNDDLSNVGMIDYQVPAEGTEPHLLAVALQGEFESYFVNRPVPGAEGEGEGQAGEVALTRSPETRLTVIGNAEFLSDLVARILSQQGGFFTQNLAFMQNLIDWMNLDNDLIAIRARTGGMRRLERTERPAQVTFEALNYLIPLGALLAFGLWHMLRRRRVAPIVAAGRGPAGETST